MIRILAIGDVMGKAGRKCLAHFKDRIQEELKPDILLANGENAAGGFGLTKKIYDQFVNQLNVDCLTMGNHWHDKREIYDFLPRSKIVIPANMMNVQNKEEGLKILETKSGTPYAVINLIGRAFMHQDNRSFLEAVDYLLERIPVSVKIRIVDMHAEATSEKQAVGQYLKGRVSLVYGTHSHVPTADERIFSSHTGFVTDVGMSGGYDSVIGIRTEAALHRILTGEKKKFEPATADLWLLAILAEIDESTGKCLRIERIRWKMHEISEED